MESDTLTKIDESQMLTALRASLEKASNCIMYQQKFNEAKIKNIRVNNLKDIVNFPLTDKEDLKRYSLEQRSAVPLDKLLRIHTSSGTSGKPVAFGYTQKDLKGWKENLAIVLLSMGFNENDVILFPAPMGLPTGLGYLSAFEKVGVTLLPTGPGRSAGLQIPTLLGKFGIKPNSLCCLPSYLFRLSEVAMKEGLDPKKLGIRKIQTGGEAFSIEVKEKAEKIYDASLFEGYGLAEAWGGPSVASSVLGTRDLTVWENFFMAEIIDPDTLEVLPIGEEGELVITSLRKEANPIVRYRTGDLTKFVTDFTGKHRRANRISKIRSRIDDMVKVKGVKLYPTDFESVLISFTPCNGEYEIILDQNAGKEKVFVQIESRQLSVRLQEDIQAAFKERLNITCKVELLPIDTFQHKPGKRNHIIDLRESTESLAQNYEMLS
jgi:phenylacetate-CoA ligase